MDLNVYLLNDRWIEYLYFEGLMVYDILDVDVVMVMTDCFVYYVDSFLV